MAEHADDEAKPEQNEMFGDLLGEPGERIKFPAKLAELRRELGMRKNVYPRLVGDGKISQQVADTRMAVLESIIEDYNVRPWPQTKEFIREWRDYAERVTFMGVQIRLMHREELLAIVAYSKIALKTAMEDLK